MYTKNENSKLDTYIHFDEYQKKYPYNGTTPSDYLKWLMDSVVEFHNEIPVEKYSGDANIYGVIFKC